MHKTLPLAILAILFSLNLISRENPKQRQKVKSLFTTSTLRMDCAQATQEIDLEVNNVRARLLNGGDMWWDRRNGQYIVPKVDPSSGLPEVTSIYAGGLWMGGFDPAGNLKIAAQTYGSNSGVSDYWPGPLTETGQTENSTCSNWDRFFKVTALEIQEHLQGFQSGNYSIDDIPNNVKGWPARGNPHFFSVYGFDLPNTSQGLAAFWDEDGDGLYDPLKGDYPILSLRDCSLPIVPDEMIFWIINDAGNIHSESLGDAIQMEVQNTAFAYASNDVNNNHTFYHHKLINRAVESIDSFHFAYWIDIDVGCGEDDYMGSDPERGLVYGYNQDNLDGEGATADCGGVPTYEDDIPMVGIDIFRGLRDIQNPNQSPLSSFMYYNRSDVAPPGTEDPNIAIEFYRYMTGSWRDGTPLTSGGTGYDRTSTQFTTYAFPDEPNDIAGWNMCNENLAASDRRNVISSSGGVLFPGAINEISSAIVWSPSIEYPCPDISKFLSADDEAQALFDNCFNILNGPDAPDLEWEELDRQLKVRLVNREKSNNFQETYTELDFRAPSTFPEAERTYQFEGYRMYQLASPGVSSIELNDASKARLVATTDIDNGIDEIINWSPPIGNQGNPWIGTTMNPGATDDGITRSFTLKEDLFATGNPELQNNITYYYMVIAYAYNNYENFSQTNGMIQGQSESYLQGRRNVRVYSVSPKKPIPVGSTDDIEIVRLDGIGVNNNFLELADGEMEKMIDGSFDGSITYNGGLAPVDIFVKDPDLAMNNEYIIRFYLENSTDEFYRYKLFKPGETDTVFSDSNTENYFEQVTPFGFNVGAGPSMRPTRRSEELRCGAVGASITTDGTTWLDGIADEESGVFDFVLKPDFSTPNVNCLDIFDQMGNTFFTPFSICEPDVLVNSPIITPMFSNTSISSVIQARTPLDSLNNVNIVLTPDKSKWSRCVVVESATPLYYDAQLGAGIPTINDAEHFNLRQSRSVTKDAMPGEDFRAMLESDPNDIGMGWFPGYAVDVQTGQRLNIFFGENSTYNSSNANSNILDRANGENMIWDPTSQRSAVGSTNSIYDYIAGGQHFIYVTRQAYDECENIRERLESNLISASRALSLVTWTGLPLLAANQQLSSYADGLIPAETVIKLRVQNPYENRFGTGQNNTLPEYLIRLGEDVMSSTVDVSKQSTIKVSPNPFLIQQSANSVTIYGMQVGSQLSIHNLSGQLISYVPTNQLSFNPDGAQWIITEEILEQLTNGVYFLQLKSEEGLISSVKWVVIR